MNLEEKVLKVSKELIEKIGVGGEISVRAEEDSFYVSVIGDDVSVLIGYRGEVLDSIQHVLNLMLRQEEGFVRLILDVDNYREGRNKALEELAKTTADKVRFSGKPIELAPMSSYERRIIHMVISEQEGVESLSTDTGDMRRIVVSPVGDNKKEDK